MSIAALFTQTVSVRTYVGEGNSGPKFASAVTVGCFINDRRQTVRTAEGEETTSETTVYAPVSSYPVFSVGSKVTADGREARVISVYKRDSAGPASAHHVQVTLT